MPFGVRDVLAILSVRAVDGLGVAAGIVVAGVVIALFSVFALLLFSAFAVLLLFSAFSLAALCSVFAVAYQSLTPP
jgi:hypothetical protein